MDGRSNSLESRLTTLKLTAIKGKSENGRGGEMKECEKREIGKRWSTKREVEGAKGDQQSHVINLEQKTS